MRCMVCGILSLQHICKLCQKEKLKPSLYKRKICSKIDVFSFYKYSDIEDLLLSKHTDLGYYIYTILAQNSFATFAKEFSLDERVAVVAIDDNPKSGYSHTAILGSHMKNSRLRYKPALLRDSSGLNYSGKSYQYRLLNSRKFKLKPFSEKSVILVDDIITTGITLTQAIEQMKISNKETLFCLTLADAKR